MELSNLFQQPGGSGQERFIFVVLSGSHVQSFLVNLDDKPPAQVLGQSNQYVYTDQTNLVHKLDESLRDLGEESEQVTEVVFGVDEGWINGEGLLPNKKQLIQGVVSDLSLQAKGYLVSSQALLDHYLQAGKSVSGLVMMVTTNEFKFAVMVDGKTTHKESIGRSQDMSADLAEGLARVVKITGVSGQELPPRLMLASLTEAGLSLEEHRQHLLSLNWTEYPIFLQVPTIELVPPDMFVKIMIQRAAVAAFGPGLATISNPKPISEDFVEIDEASTPTAMGLPMTDHDNVESSRLPTLTTPERDNQVQENSGIKLSGGFLSKITGMMKKTKPISSQVISDIPVPKAKYRLKPFIVLGILLGLVAWVGIAWWWLLNNTIFMLEVTREPKPISTEITATLGKTTSQTKTGYTLATQPFAITIEQSISQKTTGTKDIGESARGKITIFNKTSSPKTFEAGTSFVSGDIDFELTEEVIVPEASEVTGDNPGLAFGKVEAQLIASSIGEEGNIGSSENLTVADFGDDTYSAITNEAFSGGSSQEVTVVAQADLDKLLSDIKKDVIREANKQLPEQIGSGEYFTEPTLSSLTSSKYSAEVGEELDNISLDVTAEVEVLTYTAQDINGLAEQVLANELPDGYELGMKDPEVMSAPVEPDKDEDDATDQILIQLSSQALPKIDLAGLMGSLHQKPLSEAVPSLVGRSDVKSASLELNPALAKYVVKSLPSDPDRIRLILTDAHE
jgi:cytoskeletal protein RodZ